MMAWAEEEVFRVLKESTAVGAQVGDRIYPLGGASTAIGTDYITLQRISTVYPPTHDSGQETYYQARVQVDSWGTAYESVRDTADEVRKVLDGHSSTQSGFRVFDTAIQRDQDLGVDEPGDFDQFRVSQDYMIEARATT